jgi:hypothetical protein
MQKLNLKEKTIYIWSLKDTYETIDDGLMCLERIGAADFTSQGIFLYHFLVVGSVISVTQV